MRAQKEVDLFIYGDHPQELKGSVYNWLEWKCQHSLAHKGRLDLQFVPEDSTLCRLVC